MTTSFQMFLLAARELNFSRAAELAYVTPQCLSDHIRRIEEHYGVTLFTRRPKLRLTAEGETMLRYLTRIRALEGDMENELADVSGGVRGTLQLGLPTTRGAILLPQTVTQFRRQFPHVEVEVQLADTRSLETLLLGGTLDLFLGVDASQHALFRRCILYSPAMRWRPGSASAMLPCARIFSAAALTWRSCGAYPLCRDTTTARRPRLWSSFCCGRAPRRISRSA